MDQTPRCQHLRNKSMFIPELAGNTTELDPDQTGRSSHCWCNRTLTEVGPDDQPVSPQLCRQPRNCYEE